LELFKNGNQWEMGGSRRKGEKMTILMKFFNENLKLTLSKGITQYNMLST